ncbi:MAG: ribosome silencing factor [Cyclobacteriaceae bacterium]|nr:ribosome silencing factor [Cyclobacteriaceae bacterium]
MTEKTVNPSSSYLIQSVVKGMKEKKATDIIVMDLRETNNSVADFFVICTGNSDTQIDAISSSIDDIVYKECNENPWHIEGKSTKEWMLIDYITVVAHVFKKEKRDFFNLENLWGDARVELIKSNS